MNENDNLKKITISLVLFTSWSVAIHRCFFFFIYYQKLYLEFNK